MKQTAPPAVPATTDRVLDAAERLFAERGIAGVSIRDITRAASVNLAAINYHFGGKQALAVAVLHRRIQPLNERRLALLDGAEKKAAGRPVKLETILEALIRPVVAEGFSAPDGMAVFMRLMSRLFNEADAEIQPAIHALVAPVRQRFDAAFLRAFPKLTEEDLWWRMNFILGSFHHAMLMCGKVEVVPGRFHKNLDADDLVRRLVAFTAGGFRSALPKP